MALADLINDPHLWQVFVVVGIGSVISIVIMYKVIGYWKNAKYTVMDTRVDAVLLGFSAFWIFVIFVCWPMSAVMDVIING